MGDQTQFIYCDSCYLSLECAVCIVHCLDPICNAGSHRYDLCWACHSQGNVSKYHQNGHPFELHYLDQIQSHTYLQATLAPKPGIARMSSFSSINSQYSVDSQLSYASANSGDSQASYDPQCSHDTQYSYNFQPPHNPQGVYGEPREYMINGGAATPRFASLSAAIFEDIDNADTSVVWPVFPRNTNLFEPEKCLLVMYLLQFYASYNIFQRIYDEGRANGKGVAWSDAQVAHMYDTYCWEYQSVQREGSGYFMPALTRCGFLQMLMSEALVDPVGFSVRLNGLLVSVGGLTDPLTGHYFHVERESFPSVPDDNMLQQRNKAIGMVEVAIEAAREYRPGYPAQESGGWQQDRGMRESKGPLFQQDRSMRASKGSLFQRARRFGKNI